MILGLHPLLLPREAVPEVAHSAQWAWLHHLPDLTRRTAAVAGGK